MAVGLAASTPPARAQGAPDKAAAEALFDEGKRLFFEKKFAEACPRFESSERIDPGIGTLLFLADCYEHVGRIASAWATFREAASMAKAVGQAERETVARERATRLEPRLFRLTIKVDAGPAALRVKRNDDDLKPEAWNVPLPIDPGPYIITAIAPGKKAWSTRIEIPVNAGGQTLLVPALEDESSAIKPAEVPKLPEKPAPPPPPPPPPASKPVTMYVAGGLLVGAGVVAMGLSGVFANMAVEKNKSAKKYCSTMLCTDMTGVNLSSEAGTFADAATGLLVTGGVAAAAGVLVLILGGRASKPATRAGAWVAPVFTPGMAGLWAGRAW
jgi:serine/threonine-protein kinase